MEGGIRNVVFALLWAMVISRLFKWIKKRYESDLMGTIYWVDWVNDIQMIAYCR